MPVWREFRVSAPGFRLRCSVGPLFGVLAVLRISDSLVLGFRQSTWRYRVVTTGLLTVAITHLQGP